MAPVSGRPGGGRDGDRKRSRTRDRGQLIAIGALAIAVGLVALALILNTGIYTHNLASRGHSAATDGVEFGATTRQGVGDTIAYANDEHTGATYVDLVDSYYEPALDDWAGAVAPYLAADSRLVTVTPASDVEGVRIADDDPTGSSFEPAYGADADWTVASDVAVRNFEGSVNRSATTSASTSDVETLLSGSIGSTAFVAEVSDGSDTWIVSLYVDSGSNEVSAMVQNPDDTYETCAAPGELVHFDLTAGTLGHQPCQAFAFFEEADGPVDVTYHNGDQIAGRYALVADRVVEGPTTEAGPATAPVDVANNGDQCSASTYGNASVAGSGTPYVAPAIYAAAVDVTHENPSSSYAGRIRVAPDEPGGRPHTPLLTALSVGDSTADDGQFTVDWDARDPDGDGLDVSIEVASVSDSDEASETGLSASGSETLTVSGASSGEEYAITVTVSDGTHSRSVTEHHVDDGDDSGCPP